MRELGDDQGKLSVFTNLRVTLTAILAVQDTTTVNFTRHRPTHG